MLKFSMILPIYSVERFLPDCLESLLCQDIPEEEYEIICVIDGSPDNSAQVVRSYMAKHHNIKLIEQSNSGVGVARNRGFREASGKYVWFIDPDDMIASNCLGKIFQLMEMQNADIFEFAYSTCGENEKFVSHAIGFEVDGENRAGSSGSGCLSVCLSDYLRRHHIEYDPRLHYGEDYLWAFQTKYRKHKSLYTRAKLYVYRQRANSAMHSESADKAEKHMQDMLLLYDIYGQESARLRSENMPQNMLANVRQRRQLCLESALFYLMKLKLPFCELKDRLRQLKQRGCYPYHLMFWNLGLRSVLGPWKMRLFKFLFPFEPYYLLVCSLYRKFAK